MSYKSNRLTLSLLTAVATLSLSLAAAKSAEVLQVTRDGAQVMSGPSDSYYPVATLAAGSEVEVYRRLPGNWVAIRPPQGSFSLVMRSDLAPAGDGLARITRDGAASRIAGTLVNDRRSVHVRLDQGEVVELASPPDLAPELLADWQPIAPPKGEFRWMKLADLQLPTAASETTASDGWVGQQSTVHDESVEPVAADRYASTETPDEWIAPPLLDANAPPTAVSNPQPYAPAPSANPPQVEPLRLPTSDAVAAPAVAAPVQVTPPPAAVPAAPASATPPVATLGTPAAPAVDAAFEARRDVVEAALAHMLAQTPVQWRFEGIEAEVAELLKLAKTEAQQEAIRDLGERIDRYAAISYRASRTPMLLDEPTPSSTPNSEGPRLVASGEPRPSALDQQAGGYDAVGVLRPVVSKSPGAPPYAVVDAQGQVISFVTPTPQTDVRSLLGKRVAVRGTRGYLPEFRRQHVATARIAPVDGGAIR